MPTVFVEDGFRFFFYSNEGDEPAHVHVEKGGAVSKWWLTPVVLAANDGFKPPQLRSTRKIISRNLNRLLEAWREHFGE